MTRPEPSTSYEGVTKYEKNDIGLKAAWLVVGEVNECLTKGDGIRKKERKEVGGDRWRLSEGERDEIGMKGGPGRQTARNRIVKLQEPDCATHVIGLARLLISEWFPFSQGNRLTFLANRLLLFIFGVIVLFHRFKIDGI